LVAQRLLDTLKLPMTAKIKHQLFCPLEQNVSKKPTFLSITPNQFNYEIKLNVLLIDGSLKISQVVEY